MGMLLHRKKQHVDVSETINTEVNGETGVETTTAEANEVAIDEVASAEVNAEVDKITDEKGK